MNIASIVTAFSFLLPFSEMSSVGKYVRVSPDLEVYYEEAGSGPPLIMITGWTGTNEVFMPSQMAYFSRKYRVLAIDPRSQGRSSKTLENNTYVQHGKDLRAFMDALKVKDAIVMAWSWGCLDVYGYVRTYGIDNLKAFVCIDQPAKPLAVKKGDWSDFAEAGEVGGLVNGLIYDRRGTSTDFLPTMVQRKMPQEELNWLLDEVLKTPDYVAALLAMDASFSDYSEEARKMDGKIPVLNISAESRADAAKAWLSQNAPRSETASLGNHMMFREFPDKFNAAVGAFLGRVK